MAPQSSTLAWKIPWTEEPGGLPSMGSHRVGHDWSNLAVAVAMCVLSCVRLLVIPWVVARQALLAVGFSPARTLEQVAISSSRGSSRPGSNPCLRCLLPWQADSLSLSHLGSLENSNSSLVIISRCLRAKNMSFGASPLKTGSTFLLLNSYCAFGYFRLCIIEIIVDWFHDWK